MKSKRGRGKDEEMTLDLHEDDMRIPVPPPLPVDQCVWEKEEAKERTTSVAVFPGESHLLSERGSQSGDGIADGQFHRPPATR